MEAVKNYENYPARIVFLSNLLSVALYALGFYVILGAGVIFSIAYLLFILVLEYRLIRYHCTDCYYYGKTCGFGQGRVSSWFFRKGTNADFCKKEMTWKNMIPDILVSLIPLVIGIVLLLYHFDFILLLSLLAIVLLTSAGNAYVRDSHTCKHCIQRELGCPADKLFNKPGS